MAEACRVNVGGMIALLEAARRLDSVRRVVVIGTSYEYGARRSDDDLDPFNTYSASKVAAWAFARAAYNAWGLPIVSVRPFQVYGPGQRREALVPAAILAGLRHEDFRMTKGEQQRDFVYVEDIVRGLVAAMAAPDIEGRVLDLGTGKLLRVLDVVERIWELTEARRCEAACSEVGRILAGALPYRPGEVSAIPADVERTRLLTGWEAQVSLDQGLALTIEALRSSEPCEGVRIPRKDDGPCRVVSTAEDDDAG
jgi:nucleoside-diphosphate-sugar epimerase